MLASFFGPNSIAIVKEQLTFQSAVALALEALVADKKAAPQYSLEVLESLEQLGPYFVIAPGIALAHAKPSASVIEVGVSLLRLDVPVVSGSTNDPVRLLFAFCSPAADAHIEMLGELASLLSDQNKVNVLLNASAESVIRELLF